MKTIGMIGGMSWHSTIEYYRLVNEMINRRVGGLHSAKLLLLSIDFEDFQPPGDPEGWKKAAEMFSSIARRLEVAGADCLLLCANTPHMVAGEIQQQIRIPLIHIAEVTAKEIGLKRCARAALLGTRFTMERTFFTEKLRERGIEPLIPDKEERDFIHSTIYSELGKGIFSEETKKKYLQAIETLKGRGAQGVIFGCTEIPLLIRPDECSIPVFDTTRIHVAAAVDFALS